MKVLNFGSLNIDYVYQLNHFVRAGETILSRSLHIFSGGKGLNQSVALSRAGLQTFHAGSIGQDGIFLLNTLKNAKVNTDYVTILNKKRTGNAIIQNNSDGDNCIILYGGANQAITKRQIDKTFSAFGKGDYLVLQNEINQIAYIVDKAYEKGMMIILNPSPMNKKILELNLQKIGILILNEIEAGQILKTERQNPEFLINGLMAKFQNARIVLTLGCDGSCYAYKNQIIRQGIFKVKAIDTTAAGDTFTGFFLAGLAKKKSINASLKLAAKAAAIAVTRKGAAPSIPTLEEVESFSKI